MIGLQAIILLGFQQRLPAPDQQAPPLHIPAVEIQEHKPAPDHAKPANIAPDPTSSLVPPGERDKSPHGIRQGLPWMFATIGLVNSLFALALCRYRLGRAGFQQLGWTLPETQHLLVLLLMFLPLSILCSSLQGWAMQIFPESAQDLAQTFGSVRDLPLPVIVLILGVAPAVGEELLFRGTIGRGLLARHGWIMGILLTSVLFAGVHLSPAQVIGVFPLGAAIHLAYAATRSFWSPMLLHLLNNSLASVMLKLEPSHSQLDAPPRGESADLMTLALAAVAVYCLGSWLWTTRVDFFRSGQQWIPPEADCGVPPLERGFQRSCKPPRRWEVVGTLFALAGLVLIGMGRTIEDRTPKTPTLESTQTPSEVGE